MLIPVLTPISEEKEVVWETHTGDVWPGGSGLRARSRGSRHDDSSEIGNVEVLDVFEFGDVGCF